MAEITVQAGTIYHYSGVDQAFELRLFCNESYASPDGGTVMSGNNASGNYLSIPCTYSFADHLLSYNDFTTYATRDGAPSDSSYRLCLFDGSGNFVKTIYNKLIIPATPQMTTLSDIVAYTTTWDNWESCGCGSSGCDSCSTDSNYCADLLQYLLTKIEELVATGQGVLSKATTSIFGIVKLSYAAVNIANPIVMSQNDPLMRQMTDSYYLESYSSTPTEAHIAQAVADIGVDDKDLVITKNVAINNDYTIPDNVRVVIQGDGKFTVANGKTLIIQNAPDLPYKQIFFSVGTGKTILDLAATNGYFELVWWAGLTSTGTNDNWALSQAILSTSPTYNRGGTIHIPPGDWWFSNHTPWSNTIILGSGPGIDMGAGAAPEEGTTCHLVTGGDYIFRAHDQVGDDFPTFIRIENIGLTVEDDETANCIYQGGIQNVDGGAYQFQLRNVGLQGYATNPGQILYWCNGREGAGDWESINNCIENVHMQVPEGARGIKIDTVNSTWNVKNITAQIGYGPTETWAIETTGLGWFQGENIDVRGGTDGGYGSTEIPDRNIASVTTAVCTRYDGGSGDDTLHFEITINTADEWTDDDLGQPILVNGTISATITKILSNKLAVATGPGGVGVLVGVAAQVRRWSHQNGIAYGGIKVNGAFNSFTLINYSDEGVNISYEIGAAQYRSQFVDFVGAPQGKINFTDTVTYNSHGGRYYSCAFHDESGVGIDLLVNIFGGHVTAQSVYSQVYIDQGELWGKKKTNIRYNELNLTKQKIIGYSAPATIIYGLSAGSHQQEQLRFRNVDYGNDYADSAISIGTRNVIGLGDPAQRMLEFGRQTPVNFDDLLYKIWFAYNTYTGHLEVDGNQAGVSKFESMIPVILQDTLEVNAASTFAGNIDQTAGGITCGNIASSGFITATGLIEAGTTLEVGTTSLFNGDGVFAANLAIGNNLDVTNGITCVNLEASGYIQGASYVKSLAYIEATTYIKAATYIKVTSKGAGKGIGYATGAGTSGITQTAGARTNGVTANALSGLIQLDNTSLPAGSAAVFTITNDNFEIYDIPIVTYHSYGTTTCKLDVVNKAAGSFDVRVWNHGVAADTVTTVMQFVIIKGAAS